MNRPITLLVSFALSQLMCAQTSGNGASYIQLMEQSWARIQEHGGMRRPVLSPDCSELLKGDVPIDTLHQRGFKVLGGTTHDVGVLRKLIQMGVDGMITDRPDILQRVLREEALNARTQADKERIASFDVQAHRGGRGFRPENTLPSFENGLDMLVSTLELDTGVTRDHVSLVWHDEYVNPLACRRADGTGDLGKEKIWIWDLTAAEAQRTFVCDKLYFEAQQKNDLALSPVSVAFAAQEHMASPYSLVSLDQLFRFVKFYENYYRTGGGRTASAANQRAKEAARVRFNIETKLVPAMLPPKDQPEGPLEPTKNHTAEPQDFVTLIVATVKRYEMQERVEVQSFDFRTLKLVEEQAPTLPTYYLTGNSRTFPIRSATE